jgi:plasmid stabilization system protein ParE
VNVEFHDQASAELNDVADWYERKEPGLGRDFVGEVRAAVKRVADMPYASAVISTPDDLRRCLTHRFPCGLLYQIKSTRGLIIAVAHVRRRPGYWRNRLRG